MATIENHPLRPKKPRIFYGYWIVLAAFFCIFIDSGCGYYGFSLFVTPLEAHFGWGRGDIMVAWGIRFLAVALTAPFVGKLVDHFGARRIIPIGAAIGGLGFVLLSHTSSLWHFYAGWAVVGAGISSVGTIPGTTVVSNWFKKRRGTALGVMGIGFGVGGFVALLIGGYLIPNFGWKASYFALALFMWAITPLVLLVIREKPADMGLYPDGAEEPDAVVETKAKGSPPLPKELTLKMALATPSFWLIGGSFLLACMGESGITQSQVPYFKDINLSEATAATTLAVVGIWSAIGKFSFGWICDRIAAKYARAIGISIALAGTIILASLQPGSPTILIWLYATFQGFGLGSWMATMSMLISTIFGLTAYGVIFGMITIFQSVGLGIGPLLAGYMYDIMGNYHGAFIVFIILLAISIPMILAVRRPKSP